MTITDKFTILPSEPIEPMKKLTEEEKIQRRNRVSALAGVLFIGAVILSLNGGASTPREMQLEFGKCLGMVLILSAGYYWSFKSKVNPHKP